MAASVLVVVTKNQTKIHLTLGRIKIMTGRSIRKVCIDNDNFTMSKSSCIIML